MDAVYSEAKSEYTKQLTIYLLTPFHRFFMSSLAHASEEEANPKRVLSKFQDILSQVPEWNVDKVDREVQKIILDSRCDYLEELLTAVFIAHTKILTAIRIGSKNKKVQITIPKLNHFIHRALTECSRLLWTNVYLFQSDLPSIEKQKNHRQIESLLHEGIEHAIRGLLPVKNILKDYLAEGDDGDDGDDEAEEEVPLPGHVEESPDKEAVKANQEEPLKETIQEPLKEPVEEQAKTHVEEPLKIQDETQELPPPLETVVEEPIVQEPVKIQETSEETQQTQQTQSPPVIDTIQTFKNPVNVIKETDEPELHQEIQTLMLQSTPSVQFADKVHVFTPGSETPMDFINSEEYNNDEQFDDSIKILDDEGDELSDYEDMDAPKPSELSMSDFETL